MKYVFMRYPGGKFKAVTFSYDDGSISDLRLAQMFKSYGVKATFNLCSSIVAREGNDVIHIDAIKRLIDDGFEIANHGKIHLALGISDHARGIREVLDCRTYFEDELGILVRGFAYPDTMKNICGDNYVRIKGYLTDLGIAYARLAGKDNDSFDLPDDFHAWYPNAHHDNPSIMEYINKFVAINESKLYRASRHPRLFYIWGHSAEFNSKNNWNHMEDILNALSNKDDTWYATNIEICEYKRAYDSLIFGVRGTMVYNPTLITVWINVDGKNIAINPGETVNISD